MEGLCEFLNKDIVVYFIMPFVYADADEAARNSDLWSAEFLWDEGVNVSELAKFAAYLDNVPLLEFLYSKNPTVVKYSAAFPKAIFNRNLNAIKYLHGISAFLDYNPIEENLDFEIVKWLVSVGYAYGNIDIKFAIRNGHYELAKWFITNGLNNVNANSVAKCIVKSATIEFLDWFLALDLPQPPTCNLIDCAAGGWKLEIVQTLHARGMRCSPIALDKAFERELEITRWICENYDFPLNSGMANKVAAQGDIKFLIWLKRCRGIECTFDGVVAAAKHHNLDCLIWLIQNSGAAIDIAKLLEQLNDVNVYASYAKEYLRSLL